MKTNPAIYTLTRYPDSKQTRKPSSDDWDKIPFFLIQAPPDFSGNLPPKQLFILIHKQHAQQDHSTPSDDHIFGDLVPDALFATMPEPTPTDPIFGPISFKELTVTQFNDTVYADIRRHFDENVVLPFGKN